MNGHGIEQDMSDHTHPYDVDADWGDWLEATYDPDAPRYDTLDEQNGHA